VEATQQQATDNTQHTTGNRRFAIFIREAMRVVRSLFTLQRELMMLARFAAVLVLCCVQCGAEDVDYNKLWDPIQADQLEEGLLQLTPYNFDHVMKKYNYIFVAFCADWKKECKEVVSSPIFATTKKSCANRLSL
jgi:hypothetical protein